MRPVPVYREGGAIRAGRQRAALVFLEQRGRVMHADIVDIPAPRGQSALAVHAGQIVRFVFGGAPVFLSRRDVDLVLSMHAGHRTILQGFFATPDSFPRVIDQDGTEVDMSPVAYGMAPTRFTPPSQARSPVEQEAIIAPHTDIAGMVMLDSRFSAAPPPKEAHSAAGTAPGWDSSLEGAGSGIDLNVLARSAYRMEVEEGEFVFPCPPPEQEIKKKMGIPASAVTVPPATPGAELGLPPDVEKPPVVNRHPWEELFESDALLPGAERLGDVDDPASIDPFGILPVKGPAAKKQ